MRYLLIFIGTFIISILLTPVTIKMSKKWNIFSRTASDPEGKPCLGGLAIYAAFLAALVFLHFFKISLDYKLWGIVATSGVIVLLGIVDDAKDLRPLIKLSIESLAVVSLMLFGAVTRITFFPVWLNVLITLAWILFITNAFNLLDIIDGLTSGLVIVISLTLLVISLVKKDFSSSVILTVLIASHAGFLKYNYPPAKLYMGDTGSLFSGFLLAALAIKISYASFDKPVALLTPILAMSLPIYDTLFLMIMRLKKRKPVFSKTNDHFALRLTTMGYSVQKSIWIMYIFSIFLAILSLVVVFSSNLIGVLAILTALLVFIFMGKKVGMVRVE